MTAIQPDDLEAAVAAGVLPETQADALRAFVAKRHLAPVRSGMEDERFRFMRGFNDFFFAIGIVLLGAATIFFTGTDPLYCLAAAAFMWALSELLVRRMRLVLPGILLSVLFVFFTYQSIPTNQLIYGGQTPRVTRLDLWPMLLGINATALSVTIKALIAAGIAGLYYWRFRLPFTILLIAASLVLSVLAATWYLTNARSGALESSVFLACGLAVFAAAMAFDLHVPESRSLKAKRAAIRPIVDGLRHRFRISVAEVAHLDQWQRAGDHGHRDAGSVSRVQELLDAVERFVAGAPDVELLGTEVAWLELEGELA